MPKSKAQKRNEAIERNLRNMHVRVKKYANMREIEKLRSCIGIPKNITKYDEKIRQIQQEIKQDA